MLWCILEIRPLPPVTWETQSSEWCLTLPICCQYPLAFLWNWQLCWQDVVFQSTTLWFRLNFISKTTWLSLGNNATQIDWIIKSTTIWLLFSETIKVLVICKDEFSMMAVQLLNHFLVSESSSYKVLIGLATLKDDGMMWYKKNMPRYELTAVWNNKTLCKPWNWLQYQVDSMEQWCIWSRSSRANTRCLQGRCWYCHWMPGPWRSFAKVVQVPQKGRGGLCHRRNERKSHAIFSQNGWPAKSNAQNRASGYSSGWSQRSVRPHSQRKSRCKSKKH